MGREGVRRPELERAIETLGPRDVLVLAEWDRATRSMMDGIRIIERVAARGAMLKALDRAWPDLTTPIGKGILAFLSALAEDERARILARANGGRAAAKKRGVRFGPKPRLAPHQGREAARMVRDQGLSCGLSLTTIMWAIPPLFALSTVSNRSMVPPAREGTRCIRSALYR